MFSFHSFIRHNGNDDDDADSSGIGVVYFLVGFEKENATKNLFVKIFLNEMRTRLSAQFVTTILVWIISMRVYVWMCVWRLSLSFTLWACMSYNQFFLVFISLQRRFGSRARVRGTISCAFIIFSSRPDNLAVNANECAISHLLQSFTTPNMHNRIKCFLSLTHSHTLSFFTVCIHI